MPQVNVIGLLNVLEQCRERRRAQSDLRFERRNVRYAGAFSDHRRDARRRPESPYGITKMVAEHYLRFFKAEKGLDFTAFRYGNVYGPRQDPNGEAGVVSIFIGRFLKHEGVRIDWDGEQTRDYVFVKDVARANVDRARKGLRRPLRDRHRSERRASIKFIARSSKSPDSKHRSPAGLDGPVTCAMRNSIRRLRKRTWVGCRRRMIDGMRETYDYFATSRRPSDLIRRPG